jgi:hypothetical protein
MASAADTREVLCFAKTKTASLEMAEERETLAKPHGHAIAIRGSNTAKAAFLVSMLRKRDSRFARNDGGKRLS